ETRIAPNTTNATAPQTSAIANIADALLLRRPLHQRLLHLVLAHLLADEPGNDGARHVAGNVGDAVEGLGLVVGDAAVGLGELGGDGRVRLGALLVDVAHERVAHALGDGV